MMVVGPVERAIGIVMRRAWVVCDGAIDHVAVQEKMVVERLDIERLQDALKDIVRHNYLHLIQSEGGTDEGPVGIEGRFANIEVMP